MIYAHKLKKYKSYNNSVFSSSNVRFYFHILHLLHDAILDAIQLDIPEIEHRWIDIYIYFLFMYLSYQHIMASRWVT